MRPALDVSARTIRPLRDTRLREFLGALCVCFLRPCVGVLYANRISRVRADLLYTLYGPRFKSPLIQLASHHIDHR